MSRKKTGIIWTVGLRIPAPVQAWLTAQMQETRVTQSAVFSALILTSLDRIPEILRIAQDSEKLSRLARKAQVHSLAQQTERSAVRKGGSERAASASRPQPVPVEIPSENTSEAKPAAKKRPSRRRMKPKLKLVAGGNEEPGIAPGQRERFQVLSAIKFPGNYLFAEVHSAFVNYIRASNQTARLTEVPEFVEALKIRNGVLKTWGEERVQLVRQIEELKQKAKHAQGRVKRLVDTRRRKAERELEEFDRVRRLNERPLLRLLFAVRAR